MTDHTLKPFDLQRLTEPTWKDLSKWPHFNRVYVLTRVFYCFFPRLYKLFDQIFWIQASMSKNSWFSGPQWWKKFSLWRVDLQHGLACGHQGYISVFDNHIICFAMNTNFIFVNLLWSWGHSQATFTARSVMNLIK